MAPASQHLHLMGEVSKPGHTSSVNKVECLRKVLLGVWVCISGFICCRFVVAFLLKLCVGVKCEDRTLLCVTYALRAGEALLST